MQPVKMGGPVNLSFATPIFLNRWPAAETEPVNRALKAAILERRARVPSEKISNVGGWQSSFDLMRWEVPELDEEKGMKLIFQAMHDALAKIEGAYKIKRE